MNDSDRSNARTAIIEAAGELFAEHGMDGVTVRDIVRKAGANLGSLSYHFTNKEELYRAALLTAMGREPVNDWGHLVDAAPTREESPQGLATAIDACLRRLLADMLQDRRQPWRSKLLLRELAQPSSIWDEYMQKIIIPDLQRLVRLHQKAMPGSSEVEELTVIEEDVEFLLPKELVQIESAGSKAAAGIAAG